MKLLFDKPSLVDTHPGIADQWHDTWNGKLKPHQVTFGSGQKVHWRCSANRTHNWAARVCDRTRGSGCPWCAGRYRFSLLYSHPKIAKQWHPIKNGTLTAQDVTAGSSQLITWKCSKNSQHTWSSRVTSRIKGCGCPICAGKKQESLWLSHRKWAKRWHPTKNGTLTPQDVTAGSNRMVTWVCMKDPTHEWTVSVRDQIAKNGCPVCARALSRQSEKCSLMWGYPELARQWHRTKNGKLTAKDVTGGSNRRIWWQCSKRANHVWQTTVGKRVGGNGCPLCAGRKRDSLAKVFPALAREWHPTKNGKLTPADVTPGSEKRVTWVCAKDGKHLWKALVAYRVQGGGCPHCAGRVRDPLSVSHPVLSSQWHSKKNGILTPAVVTAGSNKLITWRCPDNRTHIWIASVNNRTKGRGCPYCAGRQRVPLSRSHVKLAREWHRTKNGRLTPDQVTAGSARKVIWQCLKNQTHFWEARIGNRSKGAGCPWCWSRNRHSYSNA